jgi:hypothetical protein
MHFRIATNAPLVLSLADFRWLQGRMGDKDVPRQVCQCALAAIILFSLVRNLAESRFLGGILSYETAIHKPLFPRHPTQTS